MKILFTGASSFSGMWFVKALTESGHSVTATFLRSVEEYANLRRRRVDQVLKLCTPVFNCRFGEKNFIETIKQGKWDLFCHHASDVTDYKSPDFAVAPALASNTSNLKIVMQTLKEQGCHRLLLTGSVFEQNEGAGSDGLRAVSPYGLSKGLTADFFRYYADILDMKLGKFVIPNPFGPYEEVRFTTYLMQNWRQHKCAPVTFPEYVRDNIPISLLAKAYADFCQSIDGKFQKINPSCYVESQGAFTYRFANEMRRRLNLPCEFELKAQTEFSEPRVRINTTLLDTQKLGWSESKAWDELADYYQENV